jgi:hypothetical protein
MQPAVYRSERARICCERFYRSLFEICGKTGRPRRTAATWQCRRSGPVPGFALGRSAHAAASMVDPVARISSIRITIGRQRALEDRHRENACSRGPISRLSTSATASIRRYCCNSVRECPPVSLRSWNLISPSALKDAEPARADVLWSGLAQSRDGGDRTRWNRGDESIGVGELRIGSEARRTYCSPPQVPR